jgi:hypothetical protein
MQNYIKIILVLAVTYSTRILSFIYEIKRNYTNLINQ